MTAAALITQFTFVVLAWLLLHGYLAVRLGGPARGWKRMAFVTLAVLMAAVPALTMVLERRAGAFLLKDPLRWVGYAGMGFSLLLASFFLAEDVVRLVAWLLVQIRHSREVQAPNAEDRRRFLRASLNLGVVTATAGVTTFEAGASQETPPVREVAIPIRDLHPDLVGFRIAQVTDLHVGPTIRRDYVAKIVQATTALGADVIAVTGDLVDGTIAEFGGDVEPLRELSAPQGVWFVTGNHEYYWDPKGWIDHIRGFGWNVMLNEHRVLERGGGKILLAGVTDYRSARYVPEHVSDPALARAGAPPTDVSILLAHQPRSIFAAAASRYDLQISGHTHGGQFFPMNLIVGLIEPYLSGLHLHESTWIYVSAGSAYWGPPMRLGVPKEITLLTLVRA
jgi:predicted MPP superfamily phosphohydrolase